MNTLNPPIRLLGAALLTLSLSAALANQTSSKKGDAAPTAQSVPAASVVRVGEYFSDTQRRALQDYYSSQHKRSKKCPPGLAKKNNGCMPPGQAKKWAMGQPLAGGVVYESLPEEILRRIGLPPRDLQIVRILNDILVLHRGSRQVLDAVEILGRMP